MRTSRRTFLCSASLLPDSGIRTLLQTMAEASNTNVKTTPAWQYAQLKLANDMRLFLFAISIETNFQPVVEKLSSDAIACIFLIDDSDDEKIDYSKYVINQLFGKYKIPLVFGVTKFSVGDAESVDKVRERYGIPPGIKVMAIDPGEFDHIRKLIYNLSNSNYREIEQVD